MITLVNRFAQSIINAVHALGGRFLVVDNGEYKLLPKPYVVVSTALRGGQPELRKRLYEQGQMPCEPKQYPQESYDEYSRIILSSIHEGASKSSEVEESLAGLLSSSAVDPAWPLRIAAVGGGSEGRVDLDDGDFVSFDGAPLETDGPAGGLVEEDWRDNVETRRFYVTPSSE